MNKRAWKILYSNYTGPQKRAVELISREVGGYILRDQGIYSYHVLACEVADLEVNSNMIVMGVYEENQILQKYIQKEEIPHRGYVVKIIDYPEDTQWKLVLICGDTPVEVFYGSVAFVDDYLVDATPDFFSIRLNNELFLHKFPDYYVASEPSFKTRSIFTWGHPINDYREYISSLARLKLNQIIIWNDFVPVNAEEIVEYAHSFGIQIIWGFAWGWSQNCLNADLQNLEALKDDIISQYRKNYEKVPKDGIYFQSFTELNVDKIGGVSISQAVTELVNMTAGELLDENPDLHIQFGLHATSVRENLPDISKVDKRVEIIWEDCGVFPYTAAECDNTAEQDKGNQNTLSFTEKILTNRPEGREGLVYKAQLTMDWSRNRVEHQSGPYIMGNMADSIVQHDKSIVARTWRYYCTEWLDKGRDAYNLTKHVHEISGSETNMCMAGMFAGGIWYPTAFCAQMFWDCKKPYEQIRRSVLRRKWILF